MQKPTRPKREDFTKYKGLGEGYVKPLDEAITSGDGELGNRIEIVPYTSMGERDVLGLNTIECLESIRSMLTEAKGKYEGYEEICNTADQEEYDDAYTEYERKKREYDAWLSSQNNASTK